MNEARRKITEIIEARLFMYDGKVEFEDADDYVVVSVVGAAELYRVSRPWLKSTVEDHPNQVAKYMLAMWLPAPFE